MSQRAPPSADGAADVAGRGQEPGERADDVGQLARLATRSWPARRRRRGALGGCGGGRGCRRLRALGVLGRARAGLRPGRTPVPRSGRRKRRPQQTRSRSGSPRPAQRRSSDVRSPGPPRTTDRTLGVKIMAYAGSAASGSIGPGFATPTQRQRTRTTVTTSGSSPLSGGCSRRGLTQQGPGALLLGPRQPAGLAQQRRHLLGSPGRIVVPVREVLDVPGSLER